MSGPVYDDPVMYPVKIRLSDYPRRVKCGCGRWYEVQAQQTGICPWCGRGEAE